VIYLCDHWSAWVADPVVPIDWDARTGAYVLQVSSGSYVRLQHCFLCGSGDDAECSCDVLQGWAQMPGSCVEYDARLREYRLACGAYDHHWIMHYCPACGGRLPSSERAGCFHDMDQQEIRELEARLKNVRSVEEVIAALGNPDRRLTPPTENQLRDNRLYGVEIVRQVLTYSAVARSFEIYVQEAASGEISFSFVPHERKTCQDNPGQSGRA